MSDHEFTRELLTQIAETAAQVGAFFEPIETAEDFAASVEGQKALAAICMDLIAIGEVVKKPDAKTEGKFLPRYPEIPWENVMGIRDIIAHHYFQVDPATIFGVCKDNIQQLCKVVARMIEDTRGA